MAIHQVTKVPTRKWVQKALVWLLLMGAVLAPSLLHSQLGIGFSPILTGSMRPAAQPGDVYITAEVKASTLRIGEVIAIHNQVTGVFYSHRIYNDSEVEATTPNKAQPPHVHVLYSGTLKWRDVASHKNMKKPPVGQVTWTTFPSGSAVFNAGLSTWSCQLSDACLDVPFDKSAQELIRSITLQVLKLWEIPKVGASLK